MSFKFTCELCGSAFTKEKRGYRFCSQRCANRASAKWLDVLALRALAAMGMRACEIGRSLGLHPATVRAKLQELGLYRTWQRARYAKARQ